MWNDLVAWAWPAGLTLAGGALAGWEHRRLRRLEHGHRALDSTLRGIRQELAGLRADLRDVARAQQLDDLRRALVADLRPLIGDAIDLRLAASRRPARAAAVDLGGAHVGGGVSVGDVAGRDQS